jgi:hypothetical protein
MCPRRLSLWAPSCVSLMLGLLLCSVGAEPGEKEEGEE